MAKEKFLQTLPMPAIATALFILPISQSIISAPVRLATKVEATNKEDIAKITKSITVRVAGSTQGSGVLVKKNGNRYTVLLSSTSTSPSLLV